MIAHGFRYGARLGPARATYWHSGRLHRTMKDHPRGLPEHATARRRSVPCLSGYAEPGDPSS
jgi:hypothetical protein